MTQGLDEVIWGAIASSYSGGANSEAVAREVTQNLTLAHSKSV